MHPLIKEEIKESRKLKDPRRRNLILQKFRKKAMKKDPELQYALSPAPHRRPY